MLQPVIRDAKASDADDISSVCVRSAIDNVTHSENTALYSEYLVDTLGPEAVADELADPRTQFLVAEQEGIIVGVLARKVNSGAALETERVKSHIRHFYVAEPGRGIGRCLWEEMRWRLLADQIEYVTVNSTTFAKKIYEKLGFRSAKPEELHGGLAFQLMEMVLVAEGTPLPVLIGPHILLRSYRFSDAPALQRQANNVNLAKKMPPVFKHPYALQDAKYWIQFTQDKNIWAVTLQNEVIGNIRLMTQDLKAWGLGPRALYGGELRYWLGEEHWGKGYATEMLDLLVERLRGTAPSWTTSYYLVARVPEDNIAGRRVLEKVGFKVYRNVKRAHQPHPVCRSSKLKDCADLMLVIF
mmetsp:Transcript_117017/g.342718  ORF Transcript_117017/g.342718 Transcript_117017/m.342718 type:complete len:356 (+) Transcript_117017:93-1160(+)